jgi:hypothetical protein
MPADETTMPVVRISIGRIDPARTQEVVDALKGSETTLRPAIGAMPGLIAYYVGIDSENSLITNTSVWQTREQAAAMSSLQEMAAQRVLFEQVGVVFQPVANHDTLWVI